MAEKKCFQTKKIVPVYSVSRIILTIFFSYVFFKCFIWNPVWAVIVLIPFAYLVSFISNMVVDFIFYLASKPLILPGIEKIVKEGIPADIKVAFFRPIFAKSVPEMEHLLESMKKDIINNQTSVNNLKFIVIDNTRDEEVKKTTQKMIANLQKEFGNDVVFYFHRSVKCDFFKKLGIYMDTIMLLYEGCTKPVLYTDPKWEPWADGTRNPDEPLFDIVMGDLQALGLEGTPEDIMSGKKIKVNKSQRIELSFVSDADNVWPKGEVQKMVAKMVHPYNRKIGIYQPTILVSNPDENGYIKMSVLGREMIKFQPISRWRMFHFSPFYGKGCMKLDNYVRDILKAEPLHPGKSASHDFQEALWTPTVLTEDVCILENSFSNKVAELKRDAQWRWGDMETVRQFFFAKFAIGRKAHLYVLLRGLIGDLSLNIWLAGIILGSLIPGLMKLTRPGLFTALIMLLISILYILPRFVFPFISAWKDKKYPYISSYGTDKSKEQVIVEGLFEISGSIFINLLDLVYKPYAVIKNYKNQVQEKPYVWTTGAMSEIEAANMSLFKTYRTLWLSSLIGLFLLFLALSGIFKAWILILLIPFIASLLTGPVVIWMSSKPFKAL